MHASLCLPNDLIQQQSHTATLVASPCSRVVLRHCHTSPHTFSSRPPGMHSQVHTKRHMCARTAHPGGVFLQL